MSDWRNWDSFPKSTPRAAKGGIRAQSQRGGFGENWWAKRWISVLEGFNLGARLGRGRSYARQGQVLSIAIDSGVVTAKVQGSRSQPYRVDLKIQPLTKRDWEKVAEAVSSQAIFAAKLLGGEMPHEIESAFQTAGVSLFPERYRDLQTNCSCPDDSNPCKHIAAVYYLLGEEFDRDPFLVFQLRGMTREAFVGLLSKSAPTDEREELPPPEPLPTDPTAFWTAPPLPDHPVGEVPTLSTHAALPRRLGKFPFWRGRENLADALDSVYQDAAARAAKLVGG